MNDHWAVLAAAALGGFLAIAGTVTWQVLEQRREDRRRISVSRRVDTPGGR